MIIIELAKINTACSMGHFLPSAEKFLLKELASSTSYFLKKISKKTWKWIPEAVWFNRGSRH